jgi:hypothetical protein
MKNKKYRGSNVFIVLITFLLTPLTEFDMSLFKTTAIQVSPTAGAITYTATSQRELQFGLKLLW